MSFLLFECGHNSSVGKAPEPVNFTTLPPPPPSVPYPHGALPVPGGTGGLCPIRGCETAQGRVASRPKAPGAVRVEVGLLSQPAPRIPSLRQEPPTRHTAPRPHPPHGAAGGSPYSQGQTSFAGVREQFNTVKRAGDTCLRCPHGEEFPRETTGEWVGLALAR